METFRELVTKAKKEYQAADHLTYVTYPVVKESKMLAVITEKLNDSLQSAVHALLYYDEMYKRINMIPKDPKDKIALFKRATIKRYGFRAEDAELLMEIHNIVEKRKKSPVEFARKGDFFIASKNYSLQVLTIEKVKQFMEKSKRFMTRFSEVAHGIS